MGIYEKQITWWLSFCSYGLLNSELERRLSCVTTYDQILT